MESRVVKLKTDFNNLINIRNVVKNIFDILQSRIDELKQLYSEFIHNNKNQMFVFGLDSFHFQSKLIDIEYDDMKRLFLAINNRMYCEYFKLNKIIIEYILNNITDKKITDIFKVNAFPVYKDIEPFKEYKFENLMGVHENILKMISVLITELNSKENELTNHKAKQCIGLNIDNFITTFNYNNNVMRERIIMFTTYIEFFHKLHTKYLKRFSNKIQLVYKDINNDINFDKPVELKKSKNPINNENNDYLSSSDSEFNETSRKNTIAESIDTITTNSSILSKLNSRKTNNSPVNEIVKNNNIVNEQTHFISNNIYENISHKLSNNEIHKSVSNEEVDELFFNIESSFDSIINKKENELVTFSQKNIDSIENNDNTYNIESNNNYIDEIKDESNILQANNSNILQANNSNNTSVTSVTSVIKLEPDTKKKDIYKLRKKK